MNFRISCGVFYNRALIMQSDQELMVRIRERDTHAFETLFVRCEEMLRQHLIRIVRDANAADDLVQEVFLRVWTRTDQWRSEGTFKAWLFRIATNLALNHLRSVRRRREQPLEIPPEVTDEEDKKSAPSWMIDASSLGPDAVLELTEQQELLGRFIDELPEEKREVFRLVHEAEMDIREVSETLDIPEGTVKSRLHYTKKHLAHKWQEEWEDI